MYLHQSPILAYALLIISAGIASNESCREGSNRYRDGSDDAHSFWLHATMLRNASA